MVSLESAASNGSNLFTLEQIHSIPFYYFFPSNIIHPFLYATHITRGNIFRNRLLTADVIQSKRNNIVAEELHTEKMVWLRWRQFQLRRVHNRQHRENCFRARGGQDHALKEKPRNQRKSQKKGSSQMDFDSEWADASSQNASTSSNNDGNDESDVDSMFSGGEPSLSHGKRTPRTTSRTIHSHDVTNIPSQNKQASSSNTTQSQNIQTLE